MVDLCEQRTCIKFCFKLGITATEYYEVLKTAIGEQAMGHSQTFHWFSQFKAGRTSIDDDESCGRPVSSSTPGMIERVLQIIGKDRRRTIDEVSMLVGISHGICHKIYRKIWRCDVRKNKRLLHHDNAPANAALLT